jgi:hypothetical protein
MRPVTVGFEGPPLRMLRASAAIEGSSRVLAKVA